MKLIHGDCLIESDKITNGSVDLILTDLPYGTVKGLGENIPKYDRLNKADWDVVIPTEKVMKIANRLLRKNGRMILFSQQPFTTELISKQNANVPFSYTMFWDKEHFANCLLAKKACVNYVEEVLLFSKNHETEAIHQLRPYFKNVLEYIGLKKKTIVEVIGQSADHCFRVDSSQFELCTEKTYYELIDVFNINEMNGFMEYEKLKEIDNQFKERFASTFNLWEGKKYKSNILKYKKDYDGYHPTQKPILLLEDLIKTFSNENDLVVDLTMGSGTTGVACKNTNRDFIGIELEKEYFEIAKTRIEGTQYNQQINRTQKAAPVI